MKIQLTIDGMTCGHCVARVRRLLEAQTGVQVHAVEVGSASFELAGADPQAALEALAKGGFPARMVPSP